MTAALDDLTTAADLLEVPTTWELYRDAITEGVIEMQQTSVAIGPVTGTATEWMAGGACAAADPEAFFAADDAAAMATCARCPVVWECAAYAVDDPSLTGVWGALTEDDRKAIRRRAAA